MANKMIVWMLSIAVVLVATALTMEKVTSDSNSNTTATMVAGADATIMEVDGETLVVRGVPVLDDIGTTLMQTPQYASLTYESHGGDEEVNLEFKTQQEQDLKGIEIGNEEYAIQLIACNSEYNRCSFRVNGAPTKPLYFDADKTAPVAVQLSANYILKLDSAVFDYCDERRFCDYHFQAHDLIEVSIVSINQVGEEQ